MYFHGILDKKNTGIVENGIPEENKVIRKNREGRLWSSGGSPG